MPWQRNDAVLTILTLDGLPIPRSCSTDASATARWPSLAPVHLLGLLEQLNQRGKSQRRKSRPPLQGAEQAGEALLDDNLAGELKVSPDRLPGLGCDLGITRQLGGHRCAQFLAAVELGNDGGGIRVGEVLLQFLGHRSATRLLAPEF